MLERETKREKNLELAARERRMRMQKQQKDKEQPSQQHSTENSAEVEKKYWALFEEAKARMEAKLGAAVAVAK